MPPSHEDSIDPAGRRAYDGRHTPRRFRHSAGALPFPGARRHAGTARPEVGRPEPEPRMKPSPADDGPRAALIQERIVAAVRTLPPFRGLAPDDQARVAALAQLRDYDRGDFAWREGDPSESLTVIVRGRIKIVRHGEAGDVILEIFGTGEPVGAIAVYNNMPYPASAVCLEPTTLLCLPRREYFDLLDRHPDFSRAIIRELTRLTLALTRKLEETRGQRVETRIANLFLTLAERMGRPTPEGTEIPLELSRQEIAELVGTTVESAIRVMSRWGREGVLITGERRFVVPSAERLRQVTEGTAP
jgi:CRP/FNR family transcriptional regulator